MLKRKILDPPEMAIHVKEKDSAPLPNEKKRKIKEGVE